MAIDYSKKRKSLETDYNGTSQQSSTGSSVTDQALKLLQDASGTAKQAVSAVQPAATLAQRKNDALNAYLNREDFSYDFNADALYQQYKNQYIQQGQQAMQDTMGQAAALTGGYGSSYAQNVGQQAYNSYLQQLNDVIPELYQLAYEQYQDKGNDLLQQYSLLAAEESEEYARNYQAERDAVADSQYDQSFAYQQERDAVSDAQWQQSFDEGVRQYDESMAFDREQFDYQKAQDSAAAAAESSKVTQETAEAMALHGDYSGFAELWGMPYALAETYYLATYGDPTAVEPIEKPVYSYVDDDGLYHYYYNGKEVKYEEGVNPVTGTINPDVQYGTFGVTGYQPSHITIDDDDKAQKLTKAGFTDTINGHEQNVWEAEDGSLWMWDDTKNKYVTYTGSKSNSSSNTGTTTSAESDLEIKETANTEAFKKTVPSATAFGGSSSAYRNYIYNQIISASDRLTDNEVATLLNYYGFG